MLQTLGDCYNFINQDTTKIGDEHIYTKNSS